MTVQVPNFGAILVYVCKATGKWGLYISFDACLANEEIVKAAPYLGDESDLDIVDRLTILGNGYGTLLFDTSAKMRRYFDMTVGDDGPTKDNPYDGKARVYALTCSPTEGLQTENT